MGKLRGYRARAGTILETIVALVIILTVFAIATSIFVRVGSVSNSMKKLRAEQILKDYTSETREKHSFFDSQEPVDSFEVKREVKSVGNSNRLWNIHFFIYDKSGILITDWQQYVLNDN